MNKNQHNQIAPKQYKHTTTIDDYTTPTTKVYINMSSYPHHTQMIFRPPKHTYTSVALKFINHLSSIT